MRSGQNVTKAQCQNDKCKDMNQAATKLIQQSKSLAQSQDFGALKKLFADNCEYVLLAFIYESIVYLIKVYCIFIQICDLYYAL